MKIRVETFADFVRKYGTDMPKLIVSSAIDQPLNATYQSMVKELMDDLAKASEEHWMNQKIGE